MKVTYDAEVDVLSIIFSNAQVEESDEDKPGVILDYDKDGNVVGMEVLDASQQVENPQAMEFAIATKDRPMPDAAMIAERPAKYGRRRK